MPHKCDTNAEFYSAFKEKYRSMKSKYETCKEWDTLKGFYTDMYSAYALQRKTVKQVSVIVNGTVASKETLTFIATKIDTRVTGSKIVGKDFTDGVPGDVNCSHELATKFGTTHGNVSRRLQRLIKGGALPVLEKATITTGTLRKRKTVTYILTPEQYTKVEASMELTATTKTADCVYLIKGADLIKIGISGNVNSRFKKLTTMSPVKLELIHVADISKAAAVEKQLHIDYKEFNSHGEWFNLSEEQVKDIIEYLDKL